MTLRWGICCTGAAANDFTCGLSTLDLSLHTVVAVASRTLDKARKFADRHNIPKAFGSYGELATDSDVDIVYVASVNSEHLKLCTLFLNHKKHVLCEKPLGLNVQQVQHIISLAKKNDVFLMEGVWSRFFPVYQKIRDIIVEGEIGDVKIVRGFFGLPRLNVDKIVRKDLGGGGILNYGVMLIQLADMVFGETPETATASGIMTDGGVDECANITLTYPNNKMAALVCTINCRLVNECIISGTNGSIKIFEPFWCATEMEVKNFSTGKTDLFRFPVSETKSMGTFPNAGGFSYEAEAVRLLIAEGKRESPLMSHKCSEVLAQVTEKVRNSVGYVIEGDHLPELV